MHNEARCISCIAIYLLWLFVNYQLIVLLPRCGCSCEGGRHRPALGLLLRLHYALQVSQCGLRVFARLDRVAEAALLERGRCLRVAESVCGRRRSLRGDRAGVRRRLTTVVFKWKARDRGRLEADSLRRIWIAQEICGGRSWVAPQGTEGR